MITQGHSILKTTTFGLPVKNSMFATLAFFTKAYVGSPARHQRTSSTGPIRSTWIWMASCCSTSTPTRSIPMLMSPTSTWDCRRGVEPISGAPFWRPLSGQESIWETGPLVPICYPRHCPDRRTGAIDLRQTSAGYPTIYLRRYTLLFGGFVSAYDSYQGGELVIKPFLFEGSKLSINYPCCNSNG